MADFFRMTRRMGPPREGGIPSWFSTHPDPEDRVESIPRYTADWQEAVERTEFRVGRDDFLDRITDQVESRALAP